MRLSEDLRELNRLLKAVCSFYNTSPLEVKSLSQKAEIVKVRHTFMFIANKIGYQMLPIALTVKRSSDTGVYYGSNRIEDLYKSDLQTYQEIESILSSLGVKKKLISSLSSPQVYILQFLDNQLNVNYDAETPFHKGQRDKTIEVKNIIKALIDDIESKAERTL